MKKLWIGQEIISLRDYGCRFSWEAVRCVFNKNLTKANLEGFDYITEFDLNFLTENCPRLRHLILPSAFRIEEFSLEKLTNLKTLNISKCDNLSKRVLSEGPTKLRQLTFLSLPRKFAEIESLMELTKLTHLSLSRCNKIPVDKLLETLKNLTELTSLDLGHCVQISADNLVELLKTLKKLNCLNLSENYQIPEDRLVEALKNLPKLTRLNLRGCSITDNEGAKALENLSQLTYLDLSYCAITVGRLDLLLKNLLQLRELNSMFVTEISKEDVKEWQKRYPNIKFTQCTHLDPFWDITEGELDQLLKNLPQLEEVNLMQCNRITKDIVGELRKQHTNIKFIHKYDV